jgi:photosystem II stability/assembly factor-like uncharacterized protein
MIATKVPVPDEHALGYIGKLYVRGTEVFAVGGTYGKSTLLCSSDGGQTFASWKTPETPGLRDLCLDDKFVWVAGEYGCIARTSNRGERWTEIKGANKKRVTGACLYAIERDAGGRFWVTGDDGLVLRSTTRSGRAFDTIETNTDGRMLAIYFDPLDGNPWLLDTTGELQRWTGKEFVIVAVPALKTKASMNSIVRTPASTLLIAANAGTVLRSTDNGATWKKISTRVRGDLEVVEVTRYGIFVAGDRGALVVSYDDGRSFVPVEIDLRHEHLWSIANVAGGILVGGEAGAIYRLARRDLAELMHVAYSGTDPVLAALAASIRDGDDSTEMVLEDALRERRLW